MATRPIPLAEVERREVDQTVAGRDVGRYRTQAVLVDAEPPAENQFDDGGEHHHYPDLPAHEGGLQCGEPHEQAGGQQAEQPLPPGRHPGVQVQRGRDPGHDDQQGPRWPHGSAAPVPVGSLGGGLKPDREPVFTQNRMLE